MSYFTIEELSRSSTATAKGIDNTPSEEIISHLNELIEFLNPLREAWGSPIKVYSGYRCPELNALVKGSKTSAHPKGYAADLYPKNGRFKDFVAFMKSYLKGKKFDQCIIESSGASRWVHIGLYNNSGKQRCSIFNMNV